MTEKIKILFLGASPVNGAHLRLDQEARDIEIKLERANYRDRFDLITQWAVRFDDLQHALLKHQPHIVHFSGHGSNDQGIILEDDFGNSQPVGAQTLAALFSSLKDNIRIILLNACFAASQAEAIKKVIDFTVGMHGTIGDEAAIVFASSFYRALAFGRSVQEAFDLAKISLMVPAIGEDQTPKLFVRTGADANKELFSLSQPVPEAEAPAPPSGGSPAGSGGIHIGGSVNNKSTINTGTIQGGITSQK